MSSRGHGCRGALFLLYKFDGARRFDEAMASQVISGCVFVLEVVPCFGASAFWTLCKEQEKPIPWRSGLTGAPSGPRRGGWRFDLCLDVGTTAHRMFFRSAFGQMKALK